MSWKRTNEIITPKRRRRALFTAALLLGSSFVNAQNARDEQGRMYEDDAWWDVTEWLDGNDFNPTDERIAVWDDEVYGNDERSGDMREGRARNGNDDSNPDDDWYYDWTVGRYDDYSFDDMSQQEHGSSYYDYDGDGAFDAYYTYSDWDGDGVYEDVEYIAVVTPDDSRSADGSSKGSSSRGKDRSSDRSQSGSDEDQRSSGKAAGMSHDAMARNASSGRASHEPKAERKSCGGKVSAVKQVRVENGSHTVVKVESPYGETRIVDLGALDASQRPRKGQQLECAGALTKVGDHRVLFAGRAKIDGEAVEIDRSPEQFEGRVEGTHEIDVHGNKRLMAVLDAKDSEQTWLVDLGPAKELRSDLEDKTIEVSGIPFKRDGRALLLARNVTIDGKDHEIQRERRPMGGHSDGSKQRSSMPHGSQDSMHDSKQGE